MTLRNKKFILLSRQMMRITLFFYIYAITFSIIHQHGCLKEEVAISCDSGRNSIPNPHTEIPGLFHECSFLANFILIHQVNPVTEDGISTVVEVSQIFSVLNSESFISKECYRFLSPRAPPKIS